ncbi:MAG: Rpn family recombination-promoting nuclease/putative transposase [Candidatus Eremiobacterota bacterium]
MPVDSLVNLRNDVIFKVVFGYEKNEKLLISLLNAILNLTGDEKIVKLTFLNAFNIKEYLNDKLTSLDVKVEDGTGVRYNVEMQLAPDTSYINRIIYYHDKLYTSQLKQAEPYDTLLRAISISILNFILFENETDLHNIYRYLNIKSKNQLTNLKELHFIELPKYTEDKPRKDLTKFEKWLHALKFGEIYAADLNNIPEALKEEEEIMMALQEMIRASNDDMIREILEMRERGRHEEATRIYRAEQKGMEKGKIELARELYEDGYPIEKLAAKFKVSAEKMKELLTCSDT